MTDTKDILQKIAALRVRLDKAQGLIQEAGTAAQRLLEADPEQKLQRRVQTGAWHDALLDGALRTMTDEMSPIAAPPLPEKLIARGARLLKHTRDLLQALRETADDPVLPQDPDAPLAQLHCQAAALVDNVLRTVQAFPPSPGQQLRLCQGLELALQTARRRLECLRVGLDRRRVELGRIDRLTEAFERLSQDQPAPADCFHEIAEQVLAEVKSGQPLRFWEESPSQPARFAAAHGYNVAQVLARLILDDAEWVLRCREAVTVALVHDVGMAGLPADVLAHAGAWNDEQRRAVERHSLLGEPWARKIWPAGSWPVLGVMDHHERLDGLGYPAGKRGDYLAPIVRLLAVCDVYVALCSSRPQRPALDPRAALTDTLLMADRGLLDKQEAEKLLRLGFYPVGSVVELEDGALAQVVKQNPGQPAKPLALLLTGPKRRPVDWPSCVDLTQDSSPAILRQASAAERRTALEH